MDKTEIMAFEAMTSGNDILEAGIIFAQKMSRQLNIDWQYVTRMEVESKFISTVQSEFPTQMVYSHRAEIYLNVEDE